MLAQINGTELFHETTGDGPPLMLMHAPIGFDHSYFRPWLDPLAKTSRLIYYDHRGHGRSASVTDFTGIDLAVWADDADALRQLLGHEKMAVIGHSSGGCVALEYARRYAKHLSGLILCDAMPVFDFPETALENAMARATPEQMELVIKAFTVPMASNDELSDIWESILPIYFKNHMAESAKSAKSAKLAENIRYNHHAFNHSNSVWFPAFNSLGWLSGISVPTLIITGREDWITPPAQCAERLHAGIPNSEMVIFEDSGHWPFIEEQGLFIDTVARWMESL